MNVWLRLPWWLLLLLSDFPQTTLQSRGEVLYDQLKEEEKEQTWFVNGQHVGIMETDGRCTTVSPRITLKDGDKRKFSSGQNFGQSPGCPLSVEERVPEVWIYITG